MTGHIEPRRPRLVGGEGLWTFVFADLTIFTLMFMTFAAYWPDRRAEFLAAQAQLNPLLGAANTVLLLTSSWLVAKAIAQFRSGSMATARRLLVGAIAFGAGFVVIKYFEYSHELGLGFVPTTNEFFMFYYAMTGLHLLHCIVGVIVLLVIAIRLETFSPTGDDSSAPEIAAIYWHMVDLIWIMLFPLLYLVH